MLLVRNNAVLTTPLTVTATATKIPFDTVVYNTNSGILDFDKDNNAVNLLTPGCYGADATVVFANSSSSAAVTAVLAAYADGKAIPGATVTVTIAASSTAEIVLHWAVSAKAAPSGTAKIEWFISGAAGTINNAFTRVSKYA